MVKARAAAALAAAGVFTLLASAPARAAGPMNFAGPGECTAYSAGGSGPLQFFCSYSWTGGTDPYTASATASSRLVHVTSVQAFNGQATVYGTCVIGQYAVVTLSVTDATGATGSAQDTLYC